MQEYIKEYIKYSKIIKIFSRRNKFLARFRFFQFFNRNIKIRLLFYTRTNLRSKRQNLLAKELQLADKRLVKYSIEEKPNGKISDYLEK